MSDIRLKRITVESLNTLTIHGGGISITDTAPSIDSMSGSVVSAGGVGVLCSINATSSLNGGGLTVAGGMSAAKDVFVGGNVVVDSSTGIVRVYGATVDRLRVGSISEKMVSVSADGVSNHVVVTDTTVSMLTSSASVNATTGALVTVGGVSIRNSTQATSVTRGGGLTLAGGAGIGRDVFIGGDAHVKGAMHVDRSVVLHGESGEEGGVLYMQTSNAYFTNTAGNVVIEADNVSIGPDAELEVDAFSTTVSNVLRCTDTNESTNSTTAAVVVTGGVSVGCNIDATSTTQGGAVTIAGGVAVEKQLHVGNSVHVSTFEGEDPHKVILYHSQPAPPTSIGVGGGGSLMLNTPTSGDDVVVYVGETPDEVFRIGGDGDVTFRGDMQPYKIVGENGQVSGALSVQGQAAGSSCSLRLYTNDGDGGDDIDIKLFNVGLPNTVVDTECLRLGFDAGTETYVVGVESNGTGRSRDVALYSGLEHQLLLRTDGSVVVSSTTQSVNDIEGAFIVPQGGVRIGGTTNAFDTSNGGALTVAGGTSIGKDVFIGGKLYVRSDSDGVVNVDTRDSGTLTVTSTQPGVDIAATDPTSRNATSMCLYVLGDNAADDAELLLVGSDGGAALQLASVARGEGSPMAINITTHGHSAQVCVATTGNVGIGTSVPDAMLDVDGGLIVRGAEPSLSGTQAALLLTEGGLSIALEDDAMSSTEGGSFTTLGGVAIAKSMYVGGPVFIEDETSSDSLGGALTVKGGLTVLSNEESITFGQGGSLTVMGGASINGDLYVSGSINGSGSSATTYSFLTLTATEEALNLSSGSLVTFGGITTQCDTNALSVTNGGSFLTPGGASIGKDLYVGGEQYLYKHANYRPNTDTVIRMLDNLNIVRYSIGRNRSSNAMTLTRHDALGAVIEHSLSISTSGIVSMANSTASTSPQTGGMVLKGGLGIELATDASSVGNGGALTIAGGASVAKKVHIGGVTSLSNATDSTDAITGALVVAGGVGVGKNLHIGGNAVIHGDLTVSGTTTTVVSTNTVLKDNVFLLNAGPSGSKDAGFLVQRFQTENDDALGDVVNDDLYITDTLPGQDSQSLTEIKLSANANDDDSFYVGWWVRIGSGYSVHQVRRITEYDGSRRVATVAASWTSQRPAEGDKVYLYNKPYVGLVFNEVDNRFVFASTASDTSASVAITDFVPIACSSATFAATDTSTNSSTGTVVVSGGVSVDCDADASSATAGGALTTSGGGAFSKSVYVGRDLYVDGVKVTPNPDDIMTSTSFEAAQSASNASITGLVFDSTSTWGFDVFLTARISATTPLYANFHIRGVHKGSSWEIVKSYVGDDTGIDFSITSQGQMRYTSPSFTGFSSLVFRFRAMVH